MVGGFPSGRNPTRRAMTLVELLGVVVILGIFVAVAVSRIGPDTFQNFGARSGVRRLAVDLLQARRRSIATGENHYLAFTASGGQVIGYTLHRRSASQGNIAVDEPYEFPSDLIVSVSNNDTEAEFTFEGTALAAYQITLVAPEQAWQIDVVPVTGSTQVSQTAP